MKSVPALLVAGVLFFAASRIGDLSGIPGWSVEIGAILIGLGACLFMARQFRCPQCHSNLRVHAQFREPIGNWIEKTLAYKTCPRCGFRKREVLDRY